uniref:peptidylprolyl isomerase n=1 Tax=Paramormyrops kingsleyae TaxID=1676925 RepID=A0A3B3QFY2_9TELE
MREIWPSVLYLAQLISTVACNAPTVPLDDIVIEKTFVPEHCDRAVKAGDFVRYHYIGMFPDGKKFDSSYDKGSTYNVFVGRRQLIEGMDKALLDMCVNERRLVKIPPQLAYGKDGYGDIIPPDSVLHFDVLLLDIWNPQDQVEVKTNYKPETCTRTVDVSDFVRYHYNGTLLDGTLFDSSHTRLRTYDTYVGIGWLIAGMDKGLLGMCVGEKRVITMPPFLGYGENGDGDIIPPDSVLHFDVLLLDIWNPQDQVEVKTNYKPETCTRTVDVSDFVRYHYNGTLLDGTLFDSSHTRLRTYDTYVGIGWLIAGMDKGLLGMCVGEKRVITMPPFLGYGENGDGSDIPGQASLVFDVVLLDLHNPKDGIMVQPQVVPETCPRKSQEGDYMRYHYNGTLLDGTFFDSSTYNTYIGKGYVIAGMDEGLLGVCIGERRRITIPPHLAYGEEGTDGEVPGSAVLAFDIELIDMEEGLPDGYMFVWKENVSPSLFAEMDKNKDAIVEFSDYILQQVNEGKGRLAPGFDPHRIIENMFTNQDRDGDGKITENEFKLKADELQEHDEL